MESNRQQTTEETIEALYRSDSRRIFATLVRILGDFELAEDSLHEAFRSALEQWPTAGIPANPVSWLISAGRFKAIDAVRRGARFQALTESRDFGESMDEPEVVGDEVLRLIFTCCHPAIAPDAQIALTLREVCDLTTEEIAHAFLTPVPTLAQRIVRAKAKIRDAQIPFEVPEAGQLAERLASVLKVIYLVYNQGYYADSNDSEVRRELAAEAIRLTCLLGHLLPEPEVFGLLALMSIHEARRAARITPEGELIPIDKQDRSLWNHELIREGSQMTQNALRSGRFGSYTIQAAISAVHSEAPTYEETDWDEIVGLYDVLLLREPSPVVELNRAVAIAMRDGPGVGLELVDVLLSQPAMQEYYLAHAARADLCARLDRVNDAQESYQIAVNLAPQEAEKRFLRQQLEKLSK